MDEEALWVMADNISDQGDLNAAFKLFMEGAERGYGPSMSRVASMYFQGEGVDLNWGKSIEWDLRAIEIGEDISLGNLAITYRAKGEIQKAKYWFERSLAAGSAEAALELAKLYMISEKERKTVLSYLEMVINADQRFVCEDSFEEAQNLLAELT